MIGHHKREQLLFSHKIFNKAVKISIAGDDERPVKIVDVYHSMQDKLRIHISFYVPIRQFESRFKDANIPILLQIFIQTFVTLYVTNTEKRFGDAILIFEIDAKPREIKFPSLITNAEVQVLAIYKRIVVSLRAHILNSIKKPSLLEDETGFGSDLAYDCCGGRNRTFITRFRVWRHYR